MTNNYYMCKTHKMLFINKTNTYLRRPGEQFLACYWNVISNVATDIDTLIK